MEERIRNLEREIQAIKKRNLRVEAEKAWETSSFRIFSISAATYVIASAVLYFIGDRRFLLNALIPTVGYYLSTQSLPFIKKWWMSKFVRKNKPGQTSLCN